MDERNQVIAIISVRKGLEELLSAYKRIATVEGFASIHHVQPLIWNQVTEVQQRCWNCVPSPQQHYPLDPGGSQMSSSTSVASCMWVSDVTPQKMCF